MAACRILLELARDKRDTCPREEQITSGRWLQKIAVERAHVLVFVVPFLVLCT